jgi:hypothetical protein
MAILTRGLLAAVLATALAVSGATATAAEQKGRMEEADAKASFLYNLALFAQWPATETAARDPFAICVIGATPVRPALDRFQGHIVHGRPLEVRDVREGDMARGCDIVFIPARDPRRLAAILAPLAGDPVVTVGEAEEFHQAGGMVRLGVERARLRFDVELVPAERAGIKFSSRLLALATTVRRHGDLVNR